MPLLSSDLLTWDGIKSINSYFLFATIGIICAVVLIVVLIIFAVFNSGNSGSQLGQSIVSQLPFLIVFLLLYLVIYVANILLILGLIFGVRDIRRSKLDSAKIYTDVSNTLRLVVIGVIVFAALTEIFGVLTAISNVGTFASSIGSGIPGSAQTSTGSGGAFSILAIICGLITAALLVVGTLKIAEMYRALGQDLSRSQLNLAALALLGGVGCFILATVLGIIAVFAGLVGILLGILVIILAIVGALLIFAQFVLGYIATKDITPTAPAAAQSKTK